MAEFVSLLKDRIPFEDVLSYFQLPTHGDCPDGHPSKHHQCFSTHAHGFGKCFHCGKIFDIFEVVMSRKSFTFVESARWLAEQFAPELLPSVLSANGTGHAAGVIRQTFIKHAAFYEALFDHYRPALFTEAGQEGKAYLNKRGYSDDQIRASEWCYLAPQKEMREWLASQFPEDREYLWKVENNRYVFRLNGSTGDAIRLAIPYRNRRGEIVGFIKRAPLPGGVSIKRDGRTDDGIRYDSVFHTDDAAYRKADLFGSHLLKGDTAIIVEGIPDAAMLPILGISNVVAISQGRLSVEHLNCLQAKKIKNVVIAFDNDEEEYKDALRRVSATGIENTAAAVALLQKYAPDMRVFVIDPKWLGEPGHPKDYDEIAMTQGVEAVKTLIARAMSEGSAVRWQMAYLRNAYDVNKDYDRQILFQEVVSFAAALSQKMEVDDVVSSFAPEFKRGVLTQAIKAKRLEKQREQVASAAKVDGADEKPVIDLGTLQDMRDKLYDVSALSNMAWEVIQRKNTPERFFLFAQRPVFLNVSDHQAAVEHFDSKSFRSVLNHLIRWEVSSSAEARTRPCPSEIVDHMLYNRACGTYPLPELVRVVESPYFTATRDLHATPGYHAKTKTYYYANGTRLAIHLPDKPSQAQADAALTLIRDEWLADFPFASDADKTHAICLFLQPFIRTWFKTTPLYDIEAPKAGTGKTKLVDNLAMVFLGRAPAHVTEQTTDDAWEKLITTLMLQNASYVLIDNVANILKTPHVNTILTSDVWQGRILGRSEAPTLPNLATWVMTANNPRMSDEIQRRCIRIRLVAETDRPNLRSGFKHPRLEQWTLAHRAKLIEAALLLIQRYIDAGEPKPSKEVTLGSFEEWAQIMAGICDVNHIPDFLANAETFYEETVAEHDEQFTEFVSAWFDNFQTNEVKAGELYTTLLKGSPHANIEPICTLPLGEQSDSGKASRLGFFLKQRRGQVFNIGTADRPLLVQIDMGKQKQRSYLWNLTIRNTQHPHNENDPI